MNDKQSKKRKKQFYKQAAKKGKWSHALDAGMKGFLITCNNREKEAVREAYNIFNEYADQMYGLEKRPTDDGSNSSEEDMETALKKEVSHLKAEQKVERRFQQVESGANNCIFIKTTIQDPTELAAKLFTDVYESETPKSRYIMRLLPVIGTSKCSDDKIKKMAEEALEKTFSDQVGHTFSIHFKIRNNNAVSRKNLLPLIADVIRDLNPANHPNLDNPEYVVNVDVLRTVLCISVLENFAKFRKYNLQEVAGAKKREQLSEKSDAVGSDGDKKLEKNCKSGYQAFCSESTVCDNKKSDALDDDLDSQTKGENECAD